VTLTKLTCVHGATKATPENHRSEAEPNRVTKQNVTESTARQRLERRARSHAATGCGGAPGHVVGGLDEESFHAPSRFGAMEA
jgi:hypothetical protein